MDDLARVDALQIRRSGAEVRPDSKHDRATRAYSAKRAAEGKTPREIKRWLKRYVARHLFRLTEANGPGRGPGPIHSA